jgi:hypothetical protein
MGGGAGGAGDVMCGGGPLSRRGLIGGSVKRGPAKPFVTGGGVGAFLLDGGGGGGGADDGVDIRAGGGANDGGGGGAAFGVVNGELGRREEPGIGGGLPGAGAGGASCDAFAAAVFRSSTMLEAGRTENVSDTLRGIDGAAPAGRRGEVGKDGGGGGARPNGGGGAGGLPLPNVVVGLLGSSCDVVLGRVGTSSDAVEVGRSAVVSNFKIMNGTSSIDSSPCGS